MFRVLKVVAYWLSVVLPVIDAVRGVRDGVKRAGGDILREAREVEERARWDEANRPGNDE